MPTVSLEVDGVGIEAETIQGVVIVYGRQRTTDLVEPSTATITILTPAQPWPWSIGSEVVIDGTVSAVAYRRFTGTIAQIDAGRYTTTFQCTSAGLGACAAVELGDYEVNNWRNGIGGEMSQIMYRAGLVGGYGTGVSYQFDTGTTVPYAPYTIAAGTALQQLQQLAALDIQGLVWERQVGEVRFSDFLDRNSITPLVAIEAASVSQDWIASATVFSVINRVNITYNNGTQSLLMEDTVSQGVHGVRGYSEDFDVTGTDDATLRASRILAGYSEPTWITNPITVELTSVSTAANVAIMLQLEVGSPLDLQEVTDEIDVVPADVFLEGYVETINANTWSMDLYVSDVRLTRTPQQWEDVTPTLAWSSVSGTLTWYDAIGVLL